MAIFHQLSVFQDRTQKKDAEASFLLCVFQRCICGGVIESIGEVVEEVSALRDCSVKVYAGACGIAFCRVRGLVDGLVGELLGCHLFDLSGPVGVVVQQFVHTSDAFGALFELYVVEVLVVGLQGLFDLSVNDGLSLCYRLVVSNGLGLLDDGLVCLDHWFKGESRFFLYGYLFGLLDGRGAGLLRRA